MLEKFEGNTPPQESKSEETKMQSSSEQGETFSSPEQVVGLMSSSKSEEEWNANCDKVKAAFKGYPDWWYKEIMMSGVAAKTRANYQK